ncbi:uncharacterized protein [Hoplias malabaricus]|uniref:uncharacterized protein n=1 Tax=Hoplias malabaricus TaxID=27720 RepID=UPI00346223BD
MERELGLKYPNAANANVKDVKEGKEGKEGLEIKDKDGKTGDQSRSVSVMSTLSYRKRSNLKDSIGGTGDESSLFSALKEQPDVPDRSSFRKAKSKSGDRAADDPDDRSSVISLAYSEATSISRKGLDRRWTKSSPEFDKESTVSSVAPSRTSVRRSQDKDDDAMSTLSNYSLRRSASWRDESRSDFGSSVSPGMTRRSGGQSPGSVSVTSRASLARSSRLSEFGVDLDDDDDDAISVAYSEGGVSAYSPRSLVRSLSTPSQGRSNEEGMDVKPAGHRNYLDPDLEKAINEVLSFKPIKFKRRSLEDSDEEQSKGGTEGGLDNRKSACSVKSVLQDDDEDDDVGLGRSTSSLRRSASGSALDYGRSTSGLSSHSRSSSRKAKKKKKNNRDSESESSSEEERRKSSRKKGKKGSRKGRKKESESESESSESESSESESSSESSSSGSTISYRSTSSIKKGLVKGAEGSGEERGPDSPVERPPSKKEMKKKKKKMDSLVMKYLYRADDD